MVEEQEINKTEWPSLPSKKRERNTSDSPTNPIIECPPEKEEGETEKQKMAHLTAEEKALQAAKYKYVQDQMEECFKSSGFKNIQNMAAAVILDATSMLGGAQFTRDEMLAIASYISELWPQLTAVKRAWVRTHNSMVDATNTQREAAGYPIDGGTKRAMILSKIETLRDSLGKLVILPDMMNKLQDLVTTTMSMLIERMPKESVAGMTTLSNGSMVLLLNNNDTARAMCAGRRGIDVCQLCRWIILQRLNGGGHPRLLIHPQKGKGADSEEGHWQQGNFQEEVIQWAKIAPTVLNVTACYFFLSPAATIRTPDILDILRSLPKYQTDDDPEYVPEEMLKAKGNAPERICLEHLHKQQQQQQHGNSNAEASSSFKNKKLFKPPASRK